MGESSKFVKFTEYWPNRIVWPSSSYSKEPPVMHPGKLGEEIVVNTEKVFKVTKWHEPISFDPDPYMPNIKNREPEICCALWMDKVDETCIIVHGNLGYIQGVLNG